MPRPVTSRINAGRFGIEGPLVGGALSIVLFSCIDTEIAPGALVTECASMGNNLPNVVFITAGLGDSGVVRCSGVAVTRTLIVTALGCVTLPNELVEGEGSAPGSDRGRSGIVYHAGAPEENDCLGGVATEDGSFSTLYGTPLDPDIFNVYLEGERVNDIGHEVSDIVRVPATRCSDGIALLKLPSGIGLEPIPIRATPSEIDDEAVVLSYISVADRFALQRNDMVPMPIDSAIVAPRSVELAETCTEQSGGGLFSSMTGALIGVLTSSADATDCQTPARGAGVTLAPFRRLLIETALPEKLLVEGAIEGEDRGDCRFP